MKTIFQSKAILCSIVILLITALDSKGQWEYKHAAPTGNNLLKIKFATSNIGWIIGETGTILKTTDGGNTWLNQYYFGNDDIIDLSEIGRAHV